MGSQLLPTYRRTGRVIMEARHRILSATAPTVPSAHWGRVPKSAYISLAAITALTSLHLADAIYGLNPSLALILAATVAAATGASGFFFDAGPRFSVLGAFMLSSALFVGVAGLLLVAVGTFTSATWLYVNLSTLSLVMIYALAASSRSRATRTARLYCPDRMAIYAATVALVLTVLGSPIVGLESLSPRALAAAAILFAATGSLASSLALQYTAYLGSMLALGLYLAFNFSGFGRLAVVAVIFGCAYAINFTHPRYWHKFAVVISIVPVLLVGGLVRADEGATAADVLSLRTGGLGSVWAPLHWFENVVHDGLSNSPDALPPAYGRTFFSTAVAWVPRELWDGKPVGFGAELAQNYTPLYADYGHSMAALHLGEWFVNFGTLGLLLMVPATGLLLRRVSSFEGMVADSWHPDPVALAVVSMVAAGTLNYTWMGTFAWMSREGFSLILLVSTAAILRRGFRVRSEP